MAQKAQRRLQPSEIFRYADGPRTWRRIGSVRQSPYSPKVGRSEGWKVGRFAASWLDADASSKLLSSTSPRPRHSDLPTLRIFALSNPITGVNSINCRSALFPPITWPILHPFPGRQRGIHAGHGLDDRIAMAFGHTAGRDQPLAGPLGGAELAEHAQRFVARGLNERAGVDDHDIGRLGLSRPWYGPAPAAGHPFLRCPHYFSDSRV